MTLLKLYLLENRQKIIMRKDRVLQRYAFLVVYAMVSLQYLGRILGQNTCRIICGCTVNVSMGFFRNQNW